MTEMFPQAPPTTKYSGAFESCWKVHPVGRKKAAWMAGQKAGWTDANWAWLENYLTGRWKDDQLWLKGAPDGRTGQMKKYIPHLSSIINGERWTDVYTRVKPEKKGAETVSETPEQAFAKLSPAMQAATRAAQEGRVQH